MGFRAEPRRPKPSWSTNLSGYAAEGSTNSKNRKRSPFARSTIYHDSARRRPFPNKARGVQRGAADSPPLVRSLPTLCRIADCRPAVWPIPLWAACRELWPQGGHASRSGCPCGMSTARREKKNITRCQRQQEKGLKYHVPSKFGLCKRNEAPRAARKNKTSAESVC